MGGWGDEYNKAVQLFCWILFDKNIDFPKMKHAVRCLLRKSNCCDALFLYFRRQHILFLEVMKLCLIDRILPLTFLQKQESQD